MSFISTLIIKYDDLKKHEEDLLSESFEENKKSEVSKYLYDIIDSDPIDFDGTQIFICEPEFSSFNEKVRNKLHELDVYFAVNT